jgi:hypothetical protein
VQVAPTTTTAVGHAVTLTTAIGECTAATATGWAWDVAGTRQISRQTGATALCLAANSVSDSGVITLEPCNTSDSRQRQVPLTPTRSLPLTLLHCHSLTANHSLPLTLTYCHSLTATHTYLLPLTYRHSHVHCNSHSATEPLALVFTSTHTHPHSRCKSVYSTDVPLIFDNYANSPASSHSMHSCPTAFSCGTMHHTHCTLRPLSVCSRWVSAHGTVAVDSSPNFGWVSEGGSEGVGEQVWLYDTVGCALVQARKRSAVVACASKLNCCMIRCSCCCCCCCCCCYC